MTITADTATRTNGYGKPCPPWCSIDHAERPGACVGGSGSIEGSVWTRAVRTCEGDRVSLSCSLPDADARWPSLRFDPRDAEDLAVIIELLAAATPDQHRELAAAIRRNAAQITMSEPDTKI